MRNTLSNNALDPAFVAETVLLPSEAFVGDQMLVVDPDAIHAAREALRHDLGVELADHWRNAHTAHQGMAFEYSPKAKGARRMRNVALGYIAGSGAADAGVICFAQFEAADNMTDLLAAMQVLANGDAPERVPAIAAIYDRNRDNPLVIDKWFSVQAVATRHDAVETACALQKLPDFSLTNPNRVRSLAGSLSVNQQQFHRADGAGYRFLSDIVIALDPINPQTAAKMLPPLGRWRRFDESRANLMKEELGRILATASLSKDVFEQASKSLA